MGRPTRRGGVARVFALAWPGLASAAAIVLVGASALVGESHFHLFHWHHVRWKWTLIAIAAVVLVIDAFAATASKLRQAHRLDQAAGFERRAEVAELALVDSVSEELEELSNDLWLYSDGRVSLFLCKGEHFVLAGRYSSN